MNFTVTILGCGSALPTKRHCMSSQVISLRDKLYMVDCGEGTQLQFRAMKLNFRRLGHIFISHLHGDHCFGLPGLISTLGMLGRTSDLHIYAHPDAIALFKPVLDYFCRELPYKVFFHSFNPSLSELIFEDKGLKVISIPLKHRVPTAGFLFEEKQSDKHINREMTDFYKVPIAKMKELKEGADFVTEDEMVIPNCRLTYPADPARRYAYCSDTAYYEKIIPIIEGADVLYHEATFAEADLKRANETFHSSAAQAAEIARKAGVKQLIIGHFSARYTDEDLLLSEAGKIFPNTVLADEKKVFDIGRPRI
ncbi:MAG: ribonuclease Z [Dysgonamonadaceae bacterium]|jgi:ribonuclease Z|nr:ribonuclease Z [Dysgonamonadaceae bacterium]